LIKIINQSFSNPLVNFDMPNVLKLFFDSFPCYCKDLTIDDTNNQINSSIVIQLLFNLSYLLG